MYIILYFALRWNHEITWRTKAQMDEWNIRPNSDHKEGFDENSATEMQLLQIIVMLKTASYR